MAFYISANQRSIEFDISWLFQKEEEGTVVMGTQGEAVGDHCSKHF